MASPNLSEMATVAIDSRTRKLADNVTDNNMLLSRLAMKGKQEVVDGGLTILEEIEYAENQTVKRFSGYEAVDITPSDVFTSAQFDGREIAAAVTISQREKNQTQGKAGMIQLLHNRIKNAERSMTNTLAGDVYSDGNGGRREASRRTPARGADGEHGRRLWRDQPGDLGILAPGESDRRHGGRIEHLQENARIVALTLPGHRQARPDRVRQQLLQPL